MCDLTIVESAQIPEGDKVEARMMTFAHEASVANAGILDAPDTHLRGGFAKDLRQAGVRKKRVGPHRVYFTGVHTDCNYTAFFVKFNKRADDWARDDNNPNFHAQVRAALNVENLAPRVLPDPNRPPSAERVPDYQEADWFREHQQYLAAAEGEEED